MQKAKSLIWAINTAVEEFYVPNVKKRDGWLTILLIQYSLRKKKKFSLNMNLSKILRFDFFFITWLVGYQLRFCNLYVI